MHAARMWQDFFAARNNLKTQKTPIMLSKVVFFSVTDALGTIFLPMRASSGFEFDTPVLEHILLINQANQSIHKERQKYVIEIKIEPQRIFCMQKLLVHM